MAQKSIAVTRTCLMGVVIRGLCVKGPSPTALSSVGSRDPADAELWPDPPPGGGVLADIDVDDEGVHDLPLRPDGMGQLGPILTGAPG
jgi:hypothetical protein